MTNLNGSWTNAIIAFVVFLFYVLMTIAFLISLFKDKEYQDDDEENLR